MKIAIVGAGAVGKVYGYHLSKAGVTVTFIVKEKYLSKIKSSPILLSRTNLFSKKKHPDSIISFSNYNVKTLEQCLSSENFDWIFLTISTPAARQDDGLWIRKLVDSTQTIPRVASFLPGKSDLPFLQNLLSTDTLLVHGFIALASYQAPLKGEKYSPFSEKPDCESDIVVYFSLGPQNLSILEYGIAETKEIAQLFKKGGLDAEVATVNPGQSTFPEMMQEFVALVFIPILMGLESVSWSFDRLDRNDLDSKKLAVETARELINLECRQFQSVSQRSFLSFFKMIYGTWVVSLLVFIMRSVPPFDMEAFLEYHFTKVLDQTDFVVQEFKEKYKHDQLISLSKLDESRRLSRK